MMNTLSQYRHNMIEQQIRTWEVLDERVLSLYEEIRREDFMPASSRELAYADMMLPIGDGQVALEPKLEARMLQELELRKNDKVLHIGCGSGFFAALLGKLAGEVITADIRASMAESAAKRLQQIPELSDVVRVVHADALHGLADNAPYDVIVLTGSLSEFSDSLLEQLKAGGRLLAVVGNAPLMHLRFVEKRADGGMLMRNILETNIPPLDGTTACAPFIF